MAEHDWVPLAESERDMPGIEHGPLGWQTSAITIGLQELRQYVGSQILGCLQEVRSFGPESL